MSICCGVCSCSSWWLSIISLWRIICHSGCCSSSRSSLGRSSITIIIRRRGCSRRISCSTWSVCCCSCCSSLISGIICVTCSSLGSICTGSWCMTNWITSLTCLVGCSCICSSTAKKILNKINAWLYSKLKETGHILIYKIGKCWVYQHLISIDWIFSFIGF